MSGKQRTTVRDGETSISKRRIALLQLHRSVDLLDQGDPVCALTLAAAAEEILGQIAKKKSHRTQLENNAIWFDSVADFLKARRPSRKKFYGASNRLRNEFKHNDCGRNVRVRGDLVFEAEEVIIRAVKNYHHAFGCLPGSKIVREWFMDMTM